MVILLSLSCRVSAAFAVSNMPLNQQTLSMPLNQQSLSKLVNGFRMGSQSLHTAVLVACLYHTIYCPSQAVCYLAHDI